MCLIVKYWIHGEKFVEQPEEFCCFSDDASWPWLINSILLYQNELLKNTELLYFNESLSLKWIGKATSWWHKWKWGGEEVEVTDGQKMFVSILDAYTDCCRCLFFTIHKIKHSHFYFWYWLFSIFVVTVFFLILGELQAFPLTW